jgi:hypothetical protein
LQLPDADHPANRQALRIVCQTRLKIQEIIRKLLLVYAKNPQTEVMMQKKARILIDQAHQQAWAVKPEVAAVMNPANPADASYAKMATLAASHDFEIELHESGLFTDEALQNADSLVIPHASSPEWEQTIPVGSAQFTADELTAIERFVAAGGSLLLLAETEQPKYGNNFAALAQKFGVTIENATVQDLGQAAVRAPDRIRLCFQGRVGSPLPRRRSQG